MKFDIMQCVRVLPGAPALPIDKAERQWLLRSRALVVGTNEIGEVLIMWKNGEIDMFEPEALAPAKLGD